MRSGVGLVTLAAPKKCKAEIASRLLPDVILKGIDTESDEQEFLTKPDAIAVGCGLSATDPVIEKLVRNIVSTREVPVIIDAGALWFYSPMQGPPKGGTHNIILTPHEGEFLRLLGTADKEAIKDRIAAVRKFSQKNNVILVLKGERVLIGEPGGKVVVNPTGNSGLGKAGNGDTLTGILAGFVAQATKLNIDIFETVVAAVYVAGMAGDVAEKKYGKRVMTASDVRECLTDVFAEFELN
jgi:NAD(P)H-hydrate epimerase